MTYSIVARDASTGELGVAVQTHQPSVGSLCPFAQAAVGTVATQSIVEPAYGPRGLEAMAAGESASAALARLLEADEQRELRQVAFVDATGEVAVHTGDRCIAHAGHITGDGFSCQANMMRDPGVPEAMAGAFAGDPAPLVELRRLVDLGNDNPEGWFWEGIRLGFAGDLDAGLASIRRAYRANDSWRELLRRRPPTGVLPDDPDVFAKLLDA